MHILAPLRLASHDRPGGEGWQLDCVFAGKLKALVSAINSFLSMVE